MKCKNVIKVLVISLFICLILGIVPKTAMGETVCVFYHPGIPQHAFAAGDIKNALEEKHFTVETKDLSTLADNCIGKKVVIALASNTQVKALLMTQGGSAANSLGEQAYALRTTTTPQISYWVLGGDDNGAMYGALQIAENIHFNGFAGAYNEEDSPFLKNRGIKFNIPLDEEAPTYFCDFRGTANRLAVRHVWDLSFWQTWFDEMARHRYNVLSLWCPHPFTAILNMEDEYPGIAIQGVTGFDESGNTVQINNWSIDEKIAFWQKVMKHGYKRGFRIFFCTWNIFLSTAEGMHGITDSPNNQATKTYLYKCTKKLLETYPHLTGIGITVGENMSTDDNELKEQWAWESYGRGMKEYAEANPDRELVLIHRLLQSDLKHTVNYFKPLIDLPNVRFDLSYKYSLAHAHAAVKPIYWDRKDLEEQLESNNIWSWLTVRNDDFFFLHWADPEFVRDYVNHFPEVGKYVNAIYIGPDGWVFSRVFTSKDPYYEDKNALSIQKTWYMQKIWGRIAYNPSVSDDLFKSHLAHKYPEAPSEDLFQAWSNASRALKKANEQVTSSWHLDFNWWPEGWTKKGYGYYTLEDTRDAEPQDGSNLCNFKDSAKNDCDGKISVLANADEIEQLANKALVKLEGISAGSNKELSLNLKDLRAMSHLALFNAYKFRAAIYLEKDQIPEARNNMVTAYCNWKKYTNIMDELYIGVEMQRNHHFENWHDHDADVLKDLTNLGGPDFLDCSNMYPWVKIISPYNNTSFMESDDVTVQVNAEAGNNSVEKVELSINGNLIDTDYEFPYTFDLKEMTLGHYTLSVRLTDDQGTVKNDSVDIVVYDAASRNSVPWIEGFTFPIKTTSDDGVTSWTCNRSGGVFSVKDNALIVNEGGGEGVFRTGEIDISGGPVAISLDLWSVGGLDDSDYVKLYKIVDGGDETLMGSVENTYNGTIKGTAVGSSLILVIRTKVSASDEVYYMDNLSVTYSDSGEN